MEKCSAKQSSGRLAEGCSGCEAPVLRAADSGITYVCIQVKENSLGGFTANDAIIC